MFGYYIKQNSSKMNNSRNPFGLVGWCWFEIWSVLFLEFQVRLSLMSI